MVDKQLKIDNENELNDMPPAVSSLSLTLGGICFSITNWNHRL